MTSFLRIMGLRHTILTLHFTISSLQLIIHLKKGQNCKFVSYHAILRGKKSQNSEEKILIQWRK